jgi:NADPH-dependent 2,4-dienoyl-CoA reductase/sulfur reductase-like enzyme
VHVLRSLADAKAIIARTLGAQRAAVIGASFIGLEAAAALRQRGLEVEVIAPEVVPLARILGEELGRFVKGVHEAHGVRFNLSARPRAIRPRAIELESGKIVAADLVIMGSACARARLAEAAGLAVHDGVVVNALLESSVPGVFAAGDIARYPEARLGQLVRIEHWVVAERQGQAAARAMLGRGQPFRDVPFFWSLHHDVNIGTSDTPRSGTASRCAAISRRATRSSFSVRRPASRRGHRRPRPGESRGRGRARTGRLRRSGRIPKRWRVQPALFMTRTEIDVDLSR